MTRPQLAGPTLPIAAAVIPNKSSSLAQMQRMSPSVCVMHATGLRGLTERRLLQHSQQTSAQAMPGVRSCVRACVCGCVLCVCARMCARMCAHVCVCVQPHAKAMATQQKPSSKSRASKVQLRGPSGPPPAQTRTEHMAQVFASSLWFSAFCFCLELPVDLNSLMLPLIQT